MTPIRLFLLAACAAVLFPVSSAEAAESPAAADPNKVYRDHKTLQILCKETAAHIPWEDVKYKGGIDQKGNFIVAADIGMPFTAMDYPIDIPLELNLLEKLNMGVPIGLIADARIAGLKIYEDGNVKYNGQDVTPQVGVFCRDHMIDPALLEKARLEAEAQAKGGIRREELGAPVEGEAH